MTKFTAAIAHELNNPLDGIIRYIYLCMGHISENSVVKEYLNEAQSGLKRMAEIIRSMLEFSFAGDRNHSPLIRQQVNINNVLEKIIAYYHPRAVCQRIHIDTDFAQDLPHVRDCGLQQVFMNFIKNAFDAIGKEGKLTIRSYVDCDQLCIDFIDTGSGIDEKLKDKIFEPFFSTKPAGKGLGLAIVKEIIDCYQGNINVESVSQGGAKFTVSIPIGG